MPRPTEEARALVDARRRHDDRKHVKAGAILRAVADVLEEGHPCEAAARNRGVPAHRVREAAKAARSAALDALEATPHGSLAEGTQ